MVDMFSTPMKVTTPRNPITHFSPIRITSSIIPSNDWLIGVIEFLTAPDLYALCSSNKMWHGATCLLLPNLHQLASFHRILPEPRLMRRLTQIDTARCQVVNPNQSWLQSFANDRIACSRLRSLRLGQLIPNVVRSSLLRRCDALERLSLAGCQSVDDSVLSLVKVRLSLANYLA
jgi:hypothetical protein